MSDSTIYEVARLAGVSIATVSRALRNTGPVSAATREKVQRAVEQLKFTPSRLGVSLAEGRHAANGIVFPDLSGPYFAEVLLGYEEVAAELGRSVLILSTRDRDGVPATVKDLATRVDGLVVFGQTLSDAMLTELAESGLPTVLLARDAHPGTEAVRSENGGAAEALAVHLIAHGHRAFALAGGHDEGDVSQRWTAVARTLGLHGIPVPRPVECPYTVEGGYEAGLRLLPDNPDVVMCADDQVALGVILAAEELNLKIPGDVAVTGWDDIMAARHARPALTTVRQPLRELGGAAARVLDELIAGVEPTNTTRVLATDLVIRSSCGPHPPAQEEQ
ncbi:LacI family DNA-binding transcriptional regulator [Herbidospora mongoliensis]|uniref:LacI family DNA-binding transcriptional regulator n=1 Tax=Herbidospora mongoliensis TaxID=688067 RepID=UPI00082E5838|nr:LacI family DNA-binding transcriptional regulator [Herbidospora mongoliensis]